VNEILEGIRGMKGIADFGYGMLLRGRVCRVLAGLFVGTALM